MKKLPMLSIFVVALFLTACAKKPEPQQRLLGADRDIHGCIGSAGYLWCAKDNLCVRPWELAKEKGFENDEASLSKYCNSPPNEVLIK